MQRNCVIVETSWLHGFLNVNTLFFDLIYLLVCFEQCFFLNRKIKLTILRVLYAIFCTSNFSVMGFIYFCTTFINSLKSLFLNFCYIIFLSVMLLFYLYCGYYIYEIYFFYYFCYLRHRQFLISGIFSFMVSLVCSYY